MRALLGLLHFILERQLESSRLSLMPDEFLPLRMSTPLPHSPRCQNSRTGAAPAASRKQAGRILAPFTPLHLSSPAYRWMLRYRSHYLSRSWFDIRDWLIYINAKLIEFKFILISARHGFTSISAANLYQPTHQFSPSVILKKFHLDELSRVGFIGFSLSSSRIAGLRLSNTSFGQPPASAAAAACTQFLKSIGLELDTL